jgi:hypothetical protein
MCLLENLGLKEPILWKVPALIIYACLCNQTTERGRSGGESNSGKALYSNAPGAE